MAKTQRQKRGTTTSEGTERLGPEVKRLREAAGISLRTLAERAGFSPSFISQLENGQVSPSIASLEHIATALSVTLADFFARPAGSELVVIRAADRPSFRSTWSKARLDSLTPAGSGSAVEAIMVTLEAGGASGNHPAGSPFDQLAIVFSGGLSLAMNDQRLELDAGDSVLIPKRTPHRWNNARRKQAQVLLVSGRPDR